MPGGLLLQGGVYLVSDIKGKNLKLMSNVSQELGLYRSEFEHDACGTGFTAHIKGRKSHSIIRDALSMLECMEHRGASGCERTTGDGAGILIQMPHEFL